jgi:polyhydroxyalkanoate synthesis regulator phasin
MMSQGTYGMTDSKKTNDDAAQPEGDAADETSKTRQERVSDGIKHGMSVLNAMKDAIEETIKDAKERGDLSQDRAKEVMKSGLAKAQQGMESAREAFDFVSQNDFDGLRTKVDELANRVLDLERTVDDEKG